MPDERAPSPFPYPHGALPVGTRLGEFEILRVLGVGGFGIVYLALDHLLEREVALKEYMPSSLVERAETLHVTLSSQANADTFALGLRSFVNEARLLARFDHPSLVKVHRFWEANGTAYMAMALYKGRTVRDVRLGLQARPGEAWVRQVLEPLLGAIERLHGEDVYHRDIAPDNILIEGDGRPVLLDFGAARRVITDRSQALTAILKPSYAPIEQYADVQGMKQGAWTDIYALGATVHFLLLGKPPPPAPGRTIHDSLTPLAAQTLEGCSPEFLQVVDWMLAPLPQDRPQSVAVVRDALAGRVRPPARAPVPGPFERTAPLPGAGSGLGDDSATLVMPRAAGQPPGVDFGDQATVVMPRGGSTAYTPPAGGAADEDATVVRPLPTAYSPTQRPAGQPPGASAAVPPAPVPAAAPAPWPPAAAPAPAPVPVPRPQTTVQIPLPAATAPRPAAGNRAAPPAAASAGWVVPVVAGAAVALLVGGGLWWFLTRPVSTPLPVPSAASAADVSPVAAAPAVASAPIPAPAAVAASPTPEGVSAAPVNTAPLAAPTTGATTTQAGTPSTAPRADRPVVTAGRPAAQRPAEATTAAPVRPPAADSTARPGAAPATPAAPATAPSPAPVVAAASADAGRAGADDNRPKSPSERCAKELPLVRLICIDLACNRSEFVKHPECVKLRADQAQKRYLEGN